MDPARITKMNWGDSARPPGITLRCTPNRHFSGRGLTNRNSTLWYPWVIKGSAKRIFYTGDGGYGAHFAAIGAQYGSFDLALVECGQYDRQWAEIHMRPEQRAQTARDVRAAAMLPVHWGALTKANHAWNESLMCASAEPARLGQPLTTPRLGEPVTLGAGPLPTALWWRQGTQFMRYILLNKPYEVLTQFTDEAGRATLKGFVPVPHIYPVGRLDFDSEGLLLLTDDKALQHRLSDPRYKILKTYWAQVEGEVTTEALEKLRCGVLIKEGRTAPAEATDMPAPEGLWDRSTPIRYRASIPTAWLEIRISQGMNRQVRKMCAAVGLPCLRLIRAHIDELDLGELAPGQWRELTPEESRKLKAKFSATKLPANRQVAAKPIPGAPTAAPTRRPSPGGAAGRGMPRRPR